MDHTAISLCKDNDLPVVVLNIQKPGAVVAAARGKRVGTLISAEV
jgi:uridylate kinase